MKRLAFRHCFLLLPLLAGMERAVAAPADETLACRPDFSGASPGYSFPPVEHAEYDIGDDATIDTIRYTRLPVFNEQDPAEDNLVYRLANRLHVLTREDVVARQLLVEPGQSYQAGTVAESGRLLRRQGYFYDAAIRPVSLCGGSLDLEVITKDTWSLTPALSFERMGSENTHEFGLRDSNLLGLGKTLSLSTSRETDRRTTELLYQDNNVLGSRVASEIEYSDNDDGSTEAFQLGLPFYSLDSRVAWNLNLEREQRIDEQFLLGEAVTEVDHRIEDYSIDYGFSRGLRDDTARRWRLGFRYRRDGFATSGEGPPPSPMPADREQAYPFVVFESVEDDFEKAVNFNDIQRTEDLHLGHDLRARMGFAGTAFGSDHDRLAFDGHFSDTLAYTDDQLWRHNVEWSGWWNLDSGASEDVLVEYEMRYFRRHSPRRSFFARLEGVYSQNLNEHRQVTLGGLAGARAFDNRYQVGDRRILLNLEERIYSDIHLLNLLHVGGALFVDAGRAWEPGSPSATPDRWLADMGLGLRVTSSKAASSSMLHIDLGFPLTNRGAPGVDSFNVAVEVKNSF